MAPLADKVPVVKAAFVRLSVPVETFNAASPEIDPEPVTLPALDVVIDSAPGPVTAPLIVTDPAVIVSAATSCAPAIVRPPEIDIEPDSLDPAAIVRLGAISPKPAWVKTRLGVPAPASVSAPV